MLGGACPKERGGCPVFALFVPMRAEIVTMAAAAGSISPAEVARRWGAGYDPEEACEQCEELLREGVLDLVFDSRERESRRYSLARGAGCEHCRPMLERGFLGWGDYGAGGRR